MTYQGKLKFPLIVLEGLDLRLFYTIKDLENGLEGTDVEENLYKVTNHSLL